MNTKQTEALKLALEVICGSGDFLFNWHDCEPNNEREMQRYQATLADNEKAFKAIKEALAEQPAQQQEPSHSDIQLAEQIMSDCGCSASNQRLLERITERLAKHRPASKPLTDEEIKTMWRCSKIYGTNEEKALALARAIERAHGIKE